MELLSYENIIKIIMQNWYKISEYWDIGHKPDQNNPVILWLINKNGKILTKKIYNRDDGHHMWSEWEASVCTKTIASGRFDPKINACSIYYNQRISNEYMKNILKETFGNNVKFEEFNYEDAQLYSNVNKNIYKLSDTYTDYGHNPTPKNPVIIYVIKTNGDILTKKITNEHEGHTGWSGYSKLTTAVAGRFDPNTKVCSAAFYQKFSKEYVATVLK